MLCKWNVRYVKEALTDRVTIWVDNMKAMIDYSIEKYRRGVERRAEIRERFKWQLSEQFSAYEIYFDDESTLDDLERKEDEEWYSPLPYLVSGTPEWMTLDYEDVKRARCSIDESHWMDPKHIFRMGVWFQFVVLNDYPELNANENFLNFRKHFLKLCWLSDSDHIISSHPEGLWDNIHRIIRHQLKECFETLTPRF